LNESTIRNYYIKYGVKYKRPDYKYYKCRAEEQELQQKQLEFAKELGTMIVDRAYDEIIYIDETTFHLWMKRGKCWVRPGMRMTLVNNRGPSITVIGAISEQRGLVHMHMISESNNTEHFEDFLLNLKAKCGGKRVVVALDNLKIHYAKRLNIIYDQNFKHMYLPVYSSELNPIERLWSVVKRKWTKNLQLYTEELQNVKDTRFQTARTNRTMAKIRETISKIK
jgi:transposase